MKNADLLVDCKCGHCNPIDLYKNSFSLILQEGVIVFDYLIVLCRQFVGISKFGCLVVNNMKLKIVKKITHRVD